ncbi:hypothetical protein DACRYDRAFT_24516 [Dacryopinax primogenitus]|uniref:Large ribosomal subunit protein mL49 n=1 Tax=Dacryopinax primogenitus (strain DJM 731) TaxID=1858805 RepID=M5G3Y9_DACPD|nr:uncharacterized protein DACRYDRAFT_24516 [Dacryopinax primogenitus]EJT98477.1 hypothetical protein DACRYDRAFT_24516 [Dacryopinax primogenitus]
MVLPPVFLCPRVFVRPTTCPLRALSPTFRALSTAPSPSADQPTPPPILSGDSGRPTAPKPTEPPISIEHHDALPSSLADSEAPRVKKYDSAKYKAKDEHRGVNYGYYIMRTARGGEPVYEDIVRNGRKRTLIRLVKGDSKKLQQDLMETLFKPLGVTEETLLSRVRMPGHVEFRGHWRPHVVGWMRERGF